jgi:putative ubiquitin-RnfH superfamily antitoxin RatB of RatAB toxin-antitoxin module
MPSLERADGAALRIEIAYAEPQRAIVKRYSLTAGSTVADALRLAALDPDFAAVDLANSALGIFGVLTRPDHILKDGDRIEIYRPLAADPKAARRARAQQARASAPNKSGRS